LGVTASEEVSGVSKKKSAAQAGKAVEKQARAKKSTARKSTGGELDRRESKMTVKGVSL
jgi:hypothetical protein